MQREDAGVLVRLIGSCTMEVASQVGTCIEKLASEPTRMIVVDLADLDFIESSGLGGLVSGYVRCRRRGIEMRLLSPRPAIRKILVLTRLDQVFPIRDGADSTGNIFD